METEGEADDLIHFHLFAKVSRTDNVCGRGYLLKQKFYYREPRETAQSSWYTKRGIQFVRIFLEGMDNQTETYSMISIRIELTFDTNSV